MSDLARQMERARGKVHVDWSERRARDAQQGFHRLRRRRAAVRTGAALVAALAVLVGGVLLAQRAVRAPKGELAAVQNDRVLRFEDGSVAELKDAVSVARTTVAPGRTVVEIVRGGARFDVVHNPGRVFRVEAGAVAVEDLGTRFTVDRDGPDGQVLVAVQEGRVRVLAPGRTLELGMGETGAFSQEAEEDDVELGPVSLGAEPRPKRASWKSLAQGGDYGRAFRALGRSGLKAVPDDPADLFLAADVARMSGHPADAVEPLRRIVSGHRKDPRASLAAFTLGRVLLDDLGRPREAAQAFADAGRLAPDGQLAEDALAREVEAWSRAGDTARAHERASRYVERYPSGTRIRTVRRFGGLE